MIDLGERSVKRRIEHSKRLRDDARVDGFAEVLADCGGLATRLVELHTDDGTGRCRSCTRTNRNAAEHPCRIRSAATRALHLQASRLAGRVLPKQGPGPAV